MNMQEESVSARGVDGPSARLWLTVALGILGMWFLPGPMGFFPNPFASVKLTAIGGWMVVALLGVLLLRRVEKVTSPQHLSGAKSGMRSQLKRMLRHMSATLVAPYFVYVSRPAGGDRASCVVTTFTRAAFAVFPFMFAGGIAVWLEKTHHFRLMGLQWLSLTVWTWLGCALLFFLSPPREFSRTPKIGRILDTAKLGVVLAVILVATGLALSILCYPRSFSDGGLAMLVLLSFCIAAAWLACPLLLLLGTAPNYPCIANQPQAPKPSPIRIAVAMTLALAPLASVGFRPFLDLVSRQTFGRHFSLWNAGFALDQPTIGKFLFWFTVFCVTMLPFVSVVRAISDRRSRAGYWAFAVPTSIIGLFLLSMLTDTFWMLIVYIRDMGFTPRRVYGLAFGIGSYCVVLSFLWWALRPPKRNEMTYRESLLSRITAPILPQRLS